MEVFVLGKKTKDLIIKYPRNFIHFCFLMVFFLAYNLNIYTISYACVQPAYCREGSYSLSFSFYDYNELFESIQMSNITGTLLNVFVVMYLITILAANLWTIFERGEAYTSFKNLTFLVIVIIQTTHVLLLSYGLYLISFYVNSNNQLLSSFSIGYFIEHGISLGFIIHVVAMILSWALLFSGDKYILTITTW